MHLLWLVHRPLKASEFIKIEDEKSIEAFKFLRKFSLKMRIFAFEKPI